MDMRPFRSGRERTANRVRGAAPQRVPGQGGNGRVMAGRGSEGASKARKARLFSAHLRHPNRFSHAPTSGLAATRSIQGLPRPLPDMPCPEIPCKRAV